MTAGADRVTLRRRLATVAHKVGVLSTPTPAPLDIERFASPIPPIEAGDPPGPTIVLFNDCRDQINFGAVALVDGLIRIVQQRMPDATLLPIPSHWLVQAEVWSGFVGQGEGMRQPRVTFPRIADEFESVADDWMAGRGGPEAAEYLVRFEAADAIILNGEGSIYRNNQSAVRELFLAWLAKERLGKTTLYVNGGVHLTGVMPVLNPMVRMTFSVLDAVAIREAPSLRNLAEFAPGVSAELFPDSAFVFTPDDAWRSPAVAAVEAQIDGRPFFCFDPGTMPIDSRGGPDSALTRLIEGLAADDMLPVFVSTGPWDDYIGGLADECGALFVDTIGGYREFMSLVRDAEYLVSGRYHNVILAAIMGTPSIALGASSHKVHGACEMLDGAIGQPYDGTWLRPDLDDIVARAASYRARRAELTERLQEICDRRRDEVRGLGALIDRFARGDR